MLPDFPWFIYAFVGVILLVGFIDRFVAEPRRRRVRQEQLDVLGREAERRGWSVSYERKYAGADLAFNGTTNGIAWQLATTVRERRGTRYQSSGTTRSQSVWRTDRGAIALGELLAIWPAFGQSEGAPAAGTGAAQFFVDLLVTPLINALGPDRVDRQLFTRAEPYLTPSIANAYLLRATRADTMARFLDSGALRALESSRDWLPVNGANHLIVGVVTQAGVTLLIEGWVEDVERIARLADIGTALAQAAEAAATPQGARPTHSS